MPKYVAFLRAINVGGHVVKMDVLKDEFTKLGFSNVETFIASGNVIFENRSRNVQALELKIERALQKKLGYEVATFIRTIQEVAAIAAYRAFEPVAVAAAGALSVGLFKEPLDADMHHGLSRLRTDVDDFHANEAQLYWICKVKQNESKVSNALFGQTLKGKSTFRGLRTLERLAAKYGG